MSSLFFSIDATLGSVESAVNRPISIEPGRYREGPIQVEVMDQARPRPSMLSFHRSENGNLTFVMGRIDRDWGSPDCSAAERLSRRLDAISPEAPDDLAGEFIAIQYDARERRLRLWRDPMGIVPLFYHASEQGLWLSNQLSELRSRLPFRPERDKLRIAEHILMLTVLHERTFYEGVLRLNPGCMLEWQNGVHHTRRYWDPREIGAGSWQRDEDMCEAFRDRFEEAVRRRAPRGQRVGAFLSGGLDSSSICSMLDHLGGRGLVETPVDTWSVIYPGLSAADLARTDEREFADSVRELPHIRGHEIRGDELDPLADMEAITRAFDEPVMAPNLYLHRAVYAAARSEGVLHVQDGIDGDTCVSHGYEWLSELAHRGRFLTLQRELRAIRRIHGRSPFRFRTHLYRDFILPRLGKRIGRSVEAWRKGGVETPTSRLMALSFMRPEFVEEVGLEEHIEEWRRADEFRPIEARRAHANSFLSELHARALETTDVLSRLEGVRPSYPFFDRDLIELSIGLPRRAKLRDGVSRWVLRKSMSGILPEKVANRVSKSNLGPHFERRGKSSMVKRLEGLLEANKTDLAEFLDPCSTKAAFDKWKQASADHSTMPFYTVMSLVAWLGVAQEADS